VTTSSPDPLDALSALAEAAAELYEPKGHWFTVDGVLSHHGLVLEEREFIAAMSPDVALALIARVKRAEATLTVERIAALLQATFPHSFDPNVPDPGWWRRKAHDFLAALAATRP
jgi:hypothetical protein